MTYLEFKETLTKTLNENFNVRYETVKKENIELEAFIIVKENAPCPTFYFKNEYDSMKSNNLSIEDIFNNIKNILENSPKKEFVENFFNFDLAKDRIVRELINRDSNKELLKDVPHEIFGEEFAIIYRVVDGELSCIINNSLIEEWEIKFEDLNEIKNQEVKIVNLAKIFGLPQEIEESKPMFVIQTKMSNRFGASIVTYPEEMEKVLSELGDVCMLPSSIHEWIAIPLKTIEKSKEALKEVVETINQTELTPQEFLSNNVYKYTREAGFEPF